MSVKLTKADRQQIGEALRRRANEVAEFGDEYRRNPTHYGSVDLALSREVDRLRQLADRVDPPEPEQDEG